MTAKPLLHQKTAARIDIISQDPPHALLVSGVPGIGKTTVAQYVAAQILNISTDALANYPYAVHIASQDGKAIGIEAVRQLEQAISLTVPSDRPVSRIIFVHDAQLLSTEAQNALLKTLEEPPRNTMLILTSAQPESLLPTIRSRLQVFEVTAPTAAAVQALLTEEGVSAERSKQIMALSGGLPGLALALARDETDHPLVKAAQTARKLLQQSTFERLTQVDALAKDRHACRDVLFILMQMSHTAMLTSKNPRWQKVMQAAYSTDEALAQGGQSKLLLTNLMLTL